MGSMKSSSSLPKPALHMPLSLSAWTATHLLFGHVCKNKRTERKSAVHAFLTVICCSTHKIQRTCKLWHGFGTSRSVLDPSWFGLRPFPCVKGSYLRLDFKGPAPSLTQAEHEKFRTQHTRFNSKPCMIGCHLQLASQPKQCITYALVSSHTTTHVQCVVHDQQGQRKATGQYLSSSSNYPLNKEGLKLLLLSNLQLPPPKIKKLFVKVVVRMVSRCGPGRPPQKISCWRRMRRLAPWRYTTLSQICSETLQHQVAKTIMKTFSFRDEKIFSIFMENCVDLFNIMLKLVKTVFLASNCMQNAATNQNRWKIFTTAQQC